MKVVLVAAVAANGVIGKDNALPWHLSDDLKRFKALTTGGCVVMGRATYDSIGKPLPKRTNIVVSRTVQQIDGVHVVETPVAALQLAESLDFQAVFIIGGEALYRELWPYATHLEITHVDLDVLGDRFFPTIDTDAWRVIDETSTVDSKSLTPLRFVSYQRVATASAA